MPSTLIYCQAFEAITDLVIVMFFNIMLYCYSYGFGECDVICGYCVYSI